MDEIAEPASNTSLSAIEPTTGLAEIGDGRELAVDGARGVPAGVEGVAGFLGRVLVFEACVDVADEIWSRRISTHPLTKQSRRSVGDGRPTVIIIITHNYLLYLAKLAHLAPEILVKGIEMILQLRSVHLDLGVVGGVLVEVGKEDGLRV